MVQLRRALGIFRRMLQAGVRPVPVTLSSLIPVCGNLASLRLGKQLHAYVIQGGFEDNVFISSSLIDMYCKCGEISIARRIFDRMPSPDIVSWTAMIMGYALHGPARDALVLFEKMELGNVKPNHITFSRGSDCMQSCWIGLILGMTGIIDALNVFSEQMARQGYVPNTEDVSRTLKKEQKRRVLCGHSEKLAIVFGIISTPPGTTIRVMKNLRVCIDCHTVTKYISKLAEREIFVRDATVSTTSRMEIVPVGTFGDWVTLWDIICLPTEGAFVVLNLFARVCSIPELITFHQLNMVTVMGHLMLHLA
ncbi:hypothetical protein HU200_066559 [Digitaria exilis]|uniref:DYW domain-containing protein n=1 Tax=Digitaria exilis TaxID=1010633 RepID=A0A835A223_9POAL|nr:hypothetical protein HU200_066559 [Digitaria exilis]